MGVKAICITGDSPVRSIKYDIIEDKHDARKHGRIGLPKAPLHHMSKLNWKDLKWLKKQTKLPIIIKGIMNIEDASRSYKIWSRYYLGFKPMVEGHWTLVFPLKLSYKNKKKFKKKKLYLMEGLELGQIYLKLYVWVLILSQ